MRLKFPQSLSIEEDPALDDDEPPNEVPQVVGDNTLALVGVVTNKRRCFIFRVMPLNLSILQSPLKLLVTTPTTAEEFSEISFYPR